MQAAGFTSEMFDGDNVAAVERRQEPDTGIDGLVFENAIGQTADHHGAGAAIPFGAAFLGAGQAALQAQEVKQGLVGWHVADGQILAHSAETGCPVRLGHCVLGKVFWSFRNATCLETLAKNPVIPEILSTDH